MSAPRAFALSSCDKIAPPPDTATCPSRTAGPAGICGASNLPKYTGGGDRGTAHATLAACALEMQNCACQLLGDNVCHAVFNENGYLWVDEGSGEATVGPDGQVKTGKAYAGAVARGAREAWKKGGDVSAYTLQYNRALARLAATVGLGRGLRDALDAEVRDSDYFIASLGLVEGLPLPGMSELLKRDLADLRLRVAVMREGVRLCGAVRVKTNILGFAKGTYGDTSATLYDDLTCIFRMADGLWKHKVLARWKGCQCDPERSSKGEKGSSYRGVVVGNACITSKSKHDPFADKPIDERFPSMLEKFIKLLEGKMPGYRVTEVGLVGCGYDRFETGHTMKTFDKLPLEEQQLHFEHLSNHARATACDLSSVTLVNEKLCKDQVFLMTRGKDETPYQSALDEFLGLGSAKKAERVGAHKKYLKKPGIQKFYRDLEAKTSSIDAAKGGKDFQLKAGTVVRNALVEAGFVVYDPMVNSSHWDHLHFEIPTNADRMDVRARRAAGIKDPETLEDVPPCIRDGTPCEVGAITAWEKKKDAENIFDKPKKKGSEP